MATRWTSGAPTIATRIRNRILPRRNRLRSRARQDPEPWNVLEVKTRAPIQRARAGVRSETDDAPEYVIAQLASGPWSHAPPQGHRSRRTLWRGQIHVFPIIGDPEVVSTIRQTGLTFWQDDVQIPIQPGPMFLADLGLTHDFQMRTNRTRFSSQHGNGTHDTQSAGYT